MAFGQERTPKTAKWGFVAPRIVSKRTRASVHIPRTHLSYQIASEDPKALLVFSGSCTSPLSATSECELYLRFTRATSLLPPADRFTRAATEDAALDSFQSVSFSVARFRKLTDAYLARHRRRPRFQAASLRATPPTRTALAQVRLHVCGILLGTEADERQAAWDEVGVFPRDLFCLTRIFLPP
ncbi:hypothetical protein EDB89DRAFT_2233359 [Lactarius sanguifluus]|nr:hypothetical protein EDB89DRAFT_2233359 [Lactarius sanguifluus]